MLYPHSGIQIYYEKPCTTWTPKNIDACNFIPNNINKNKKTKLIKQYFVIKIDLSVGVSIKNIGNYIKTSVSRGNPENGGLKSFNSLNIKTTSNNLKTNPSTNHIYSSDKGRKSATLVHRHSNPSSSLSNNHHHASPLASHHHHVNSKPRALQQSTAAEVNALPRIRVQSWMCHLK